MLHRKEYFDSNNMFKDYEIDLMKELFSSCVQCPDVDCILIKPEEGEVDYGFVDGFDWYLDTTINIIYNNRLLGRGGINKLRKLSELIENKMFNLYMDDRATCYKQSFRIKFIDKDNEDDMKRIDLPHSYIYYDNDGDYTEYLNLYSSTPKDDGYTYAEIQNIDELYNIPTSSTMRSKGRIKNTNIC